jgi:hypothetical protein
LFPGVRTYKFRATSDASGVHGRVQALLNREVDGPFISVRLLFHSMPYLYLLAATASLAIRKKFFSQKILNKIFQDVL